MTREEQSLRNGYCPLCGFYLALDYDNHLFACILKNERGWWIRPLALVANGGDDRTAKRSEPDGK